MFVENSPNGFTVHRYDNENVNESKNDITIRGSSFDDPEKYYPDYEKYRKQGNVSESTWEEDTKKSQEKLEELKKTEEKSGTVINQDDNTVVMDPNAFFNNSQVYVLYNLGDAMKNRK